jgi:hypothetical protein
VVIGGGALLAVFAGFVILAGGTLFLRGRSQRAPEGAPPGDSTAAPARSTASTAPIIAPVEPMPLDPAMPASGNGRGDCAIRNGSRPSAELWLDGKNTGRKTPVSGFRIACGIHRLSLRRPDTGAERSEVIKTSPGKPFGGDFTVE